MSYGPELEIKGWDVESTALKNWDVDLDRLDDALQSQEVRAASPSCVWAQPLARLKTALSVMKNGSKEQPKSVKVEPQRPSASPQLVGCEGDPLHWKTQDVISWLRAYAQLDNDLMEAFELVRVDGRMLLDKVVPPELFKEMRRWHLHRASYIPTIPQTMLQETLYLCYGR